MTSSNLFRANSERFRESDPDLRCWPTPKRESNSIAVHRETLKKSVQTLYLRVGPTSSDVMPTATTITTHTYGLGPIESVAGRCVTTTHSPAEKYNARCVPNSPDPSLFARKACFPVICRRWRGPSGLWADHQVGGGLVAKSFRDGGTGRPAPGPPRDSP
jgi:hypothetical protein